MDNQHKKIKGYRDLSQAEIDLMNQIKAKGAELLDLQRQVVSGLHQQSSALRDACHKPGVHEVEKTKAALEAFNAFQEAEPQRWASIAKTDIQTGLMALIRAVAQPSV